MKLEKFKEKNPVHTGMIIVSTILVLLTAALILYKSFALYEQRNSFEIVNGQVPDQNYDAMLSFYVDDGEGNQSFVESMPMENGHNYEVTVTCNNGATGDWDYNAWEPNLHNITKSRTKCNLLFVKSNRYKERILNGADPVLAEGLIPVTISDDGTVTIADLDSEWYSYQNQKWANAIILNSGKSASDYADKVVPEEDIESYFVWIPRYRYKIWNTGSGYTGLTSVSNEVRDIEVTFENKDTPASTGSDVGEELTHPAFTAFGTNGLWIGKFETGYRGATSTAGARSNTYDTSKVVIKPNVYSWRNIQVANAHKNSFNYKRQYDSHMMKNTEWGAVAYLQHSLYGSRKSVRINNNSSYVTGYAAKNEPTTGYGNYSTIASRPPKEDGDYACNYLSPQKDSDGNTIADLASTTANKSGVYDMSGGAWEYAMGVMTYSNGALCAGSNSTYTSGFAGVYCENDSTTGGEAFPAEKYYDKYGYATVYEQYQRGILGDATKEMGPFAKAKYGDQTIQIGSWYKDEAWFVCSLKPWFARGGDYDGGTDAGVFAFYPDYGSVRTWIGFRVVLAI